MMILQLVHVVFPFLRHATIISSCVTMLLLWTIKTLIRISEVWIIFYSTRATFTAVHEARG
jgi:hypothetical protein